MKGYTVFNAEQVDGLPGHFYATVPPLNKEINRLDTVEAFFATTKATIQHGGRAVGDESASRNRKFESTPLQRIVRVSRDFALSRRKAGLFPPVCGRSRQCGRERRAWRDDMAPTGGKVSVGPNSSTAAWMRAVDSSSGSGKGKAEHGTLIAPGKG